MKELIVLILAYTISGIMYAQELHWTPEQGSFEDYMALTSVIQIDGIEQTSDQLEVGAFCGEQCRGAKMAVHWNPIPQLDRYVVYMEVYGENGESVSFKMFDHSTNQELELTFPDPIAWTQSTTQYNELNPYVLSFTTSTTTNTGSGDWSDPAVWGGTEPSATANVQVNTGNVTIGDNGAVEVTVANLEINNGATLTIEAGSTLVVTGDLVNTNEASLVIEDGAQVINTSDNVKATAKKRVIGYNTKASDGWYTIASSVDEMTIAGSSFLTPNYDLYRYNEANVGEEWENYKDNSNIDFTTFENGRGYLYANSNSLSPSFVGTLNSDDVVCTVTYTDRTDGLSGFNLIGNPFPHTIYKGSGGAIDNANLASGYCTLVGGDAWQVHTCDDPILSGQGFLVKTTTGQDVTIAKTTAAATGESSAAKSAPGRLDLAVTNGDSEDRAFVYFGQGIDLEKMPNFSDQTPSLWIYDEGNNCAIAHVENACEELDLFFRNKLNTDFTFRVGSKNANFNYLQLIDNITGVITDLLKQPEYTFHATGNEIIARFKLRFRVMTSVGETVDDAPFAYVFDRHIILSGVEENATLEVLDMTGRFVSPNNLATGVYVLRLINDNKVRIQKIVVQ